MNCEDLVRVTLARSLLRAIDSSCDSSDIIIGEQHHSLI